MSLSISRDVLVQGTSLAHGNLIGAD